jgi:uncharacterized protein with GYD domain
VGEELRMPLYVSLITWTDQGIRNYRQTVQRANDFRNMVERAGGKIRELIWTLGEYDIVAVMEAPDDETATALLLQTSSLGNIRTKSLRGFDADQMADIVGRTS